jgi:hypothetical protein
MPVVQNQIAPPIDKIESPETGSRTRPAAVVAILGSALLFVGQRHEQWFDEAQAWLLARDNSLWSLVAHAVRYEGSPGLWHALLWALIRLGVPYTALTFISVAAACLGAWIVLTRAPFPFWMRVGVCFSYFFAYQYAVVARSYCLDLVWIPLAATLYQTRFRRCFAYAFVLGLCANSNAHGFVFAAVLWAEFLRTAWRERGSRAPGLLPATAVFGTFAAAAVLQTWPPQDLGYARGPFELLKNLSPRRLQLQTLEAFFDRGNVFGFRPPTADDQAAGLCLTLLVLVAVALLCRKAGKLALFAGIVGGLSIFALLEHINAWHGGLVFLAWLFCMWISWAAVASLRSAQRTMLLTALGGLLAVHVWYTLVAWRNEVNLPYSGSPAAAAALTAYTAHDPNARIASVGFKSFGVQPWFSHNLFANYFDGAAKPGYYEWRRGVSYPRHVNLDAWRETARGQKYDLLLLSTYGAEDAIAAHSSAARQSGYCLVSIYPGGLIWKSYIREADGFALFGRCPQGAP